MVLGNFASDYVLIEHYLMGFNVASSRIEEICLSLLERMLYNVKERKYPLRSKYPLSTFHILKAHGKSSLKSHLIDGGFMINAMKASQWIHTAVESTVDQLVNIAIFNMNLQWHRTTMRLQVIVKDLSEI